MNHTGIQSSSSLRLFMHTTHWYLGSETLDSLSVVSSLPFYFLINVRFQYYYEPLNGLFNWPLAINIWLKSFFPMINLFGIIWSPKLLSFYEGEGPELIYRGFTWRWSFIFFPKSFQNLSQKCKFLFCLYFSVSHKSQIQNLSSYFLKCMFWLKKAIINIIFVLYCCWYVTLNIQKNKEKQKV